MQLKISENLKRAIKQCTYFTEVGKCKGFGNMQSVTQTCKTNYRC